MPRDTLSQAFCRVTTNAMRSQDSSGSRRCPRSSVVRVVGLGFQHGFFYESLTAGLLRNSWPYDRKAVVTCQSDRIIIHLSPRLWATQLFPTVSKFLKRKERLLVVGGFYALSRAPTNSAFDAHSSFGLSLRTVLSENRSPFASFRAWGGLLWLCYN